MVRIGDERYDADLVVFDKDGLLFRSKPFWIGLAHARVTLLKQYLDDDLVEKWLRFMRIKFYREEGEVIISEINPIGIIAVASPEEERILTAGFLAEHTGMIWTQACEAARSIFEKSDAIMDLKKSLIPAKGFPGIFHRLRKAGIPYGIATSDDYGRAIESINYYDDANALSFVITPKDVTYGKPNPEMLYRIEQKTGISVRKMMMVGDSYVDVKMAYEAGAIGIGIPEMDSMADKMKCYARNIIVSLDDIIVE